jgi:alkanesulfonate monooxygenase SsuD/methylene tetrahydromethanopterin reductase-like flavin-dependent oxidoreductase (luciferase family)
VALDAARPAPGTATAPGGRFPFRFGLGLPTSGPFSQPETILSLADAADRLSLDDVWVNDHLNFDRARMASSPAGSLDALRDDQDPNFFESVTTASILAGRLRRIGIGIGGLVAPLRHPVILAKQIATLAELGGRPLTVAPGIGGAAKDFALTQKPWDRRGRLLDEYLAALHAIWFGEQPVSFAGPTVSIQEATLYPRPRRLRLWITGESEPALKRVVAWGQGWFTSYPEPSEFAAKVWRLRALAEAAGRDPDTLDTAAIVFVCLAPTREQALAIGGPTLARRFKSLERGLAVSAVGSSSEVQAQLAARFRAGLRYVELRFVSHDVAGFTDMLRAVDADVLPALRTLT